MSDAHIPALLATPRETPPPPPPPPREGAGVLHVQGFRLRLRLALLKLPCYVDAQSQGKKEQKEAQVAVAAEQVAQEASGQSPSDDGSITQQHFRAQLEVIDKSLRALPATAQVTCTEIAVKRSRVTFVCCGTAAAWPGSAPKLPAATTHRHGRSAVCPSVLQVANQQGRYLARLLNSHHVGAHMDATSPNGLPASVPKFKYRHLGAQLFCFDGAVGLWPDAVRHRFLPRAFCA